jgi:predicted aspartyl protease
MLVLGRRKALQLSASPIFGVVALEAAPGPCVVTASLEGQTARMVLDTGAERTVVTRDAVAKYRLALDPWVGTTMRGAAGKLDQHQNAVVHRLSLDGIGLFQREAGKPLSLPVTSLGLGGLAGLIGGDVLSRHTVLVDRPGGSVSLLPPDTRIGAGAVPLTILRRFLALAKVTLDGHELVALIDTGASGSLLNARGMHRVGLAPSDAARDPMVSSQAIGGQFQANQHRFREIRFGRLVISGFSMPVLATPEPAFDLVLGMDVLGRSAFRLSYLSARLELI